MAWRKALEEEEGREEEVAPLMEEEVVPLMDVEGVLVEGVHA